MDDVSYLVESGVIANEKPLQALEAKKHFWVIRGVWHSEDPGSVIARGAIILNDETIVRIDGPHCLFCDTDYRNLEPDDLEIFSQCRGVAS